MNDSWTVSDAWLLAAIALTGGAKTLAKVIGTADAIDHNVCTEVEFCRSVGRLIAAGLIAADPYQDRYRPTTDGAAIPKHWRKGMFTWAAAITPQLERLSQPHDASWSLPEGAYDQAVSCYRASVSRKFRSLSSQAG
ncbi:MAG TPA: hypothetical protein VKB62_03045 [Streptosporangiaceae bacterium]|nr:hypothetical protein [Streptosporangiaceae bacterium]